MLRAGSVALHMRGSVRSHRWRQAVPAATGRGQYNLRGRIVVHKGKLWQIVFSTKNDLEKSELLCLLFCVLYTLLISSQPASTSSCSQPTVMMVCLFRPVHQHHGKEESSEDSEVGLRSRPGGDPQGDDEPDRWTAAEYVASREPSFPSL